MRGGTRIYLGVFGSLAALAGAEHGIGELLQGGAAPAGLVFASWPESAFFSSLAGEPAMSLVPNLAASGALSLLVSSGLAAVSWFLAPRKGGGAALFLGSLLLLLVGGGFGPPLFGFILAFFAALRNHARGRPSRLPPRLGKALSRAWPWCFALALGSWLFMMPGIPLLASFQGTVNPVLIYTIGGIGFASLIASGGLSLLRDRYAGSAEREAAPRES